MIFLMTAVMVGLQLVDGWSTYYALKRRSAREMNPAVAWLIARLGLYAGLLVAKGWATVILAAGWVLGWWTAGDQGLGALFALTVVYAWAVSGNLDLVDRHE